MTKYSAPSIEVVTFNPSDAPRIGMQWWVSMETEGQFTALGQNWTPAVPDRFLVRCEWVGSYAFFEETVTSYNCWEENLQNSVPGAYVFADGKNLVVDDHKSC